MVTAQNAKTVLSLLNAYRNIPSDKPAKPRFGTIALTAKNLGVTSQSTLESMGVDSACFKDQVWQSFSGVKPEVRNRVLNHLRLTCKPFVEKPKVLTVET